MLKFLINAISRSIGFSKTESKGTLLLILIIITGIIFSRLYVSTLKNPTNSSDEIAALEKWVNDIESNYSVKTKQVHSKVPGEDLHEEVVNRSPKESENTAANPPLSAPETSTLFLVADLNSATREDLQKVKGIGPTYSERIIKFRELLGGFSGNHQLGEVYGLPPETIEELQKFFAVQTSPRLLNVNSDSAKVLSRHPYVSYDLAWIIINYRKHNGDIRSAEDLRKIKAIDDSTYLKLKPYLD